MIDVSTFLENLSSGPVLVLGLGKSNRAVIEVLKIADADIRAWDDNETAREALNDVQISDDIEGCACLVVSPGVPLTHDLVQKARGENIEILCDIEILQRCNHGKKTIGITGTNGKSTTTALIQHILTCCGKNAVMGGNIGEPVLSMALADYVVLELSSYQLDLCPTFTPDIALCLNISPDHIDHHGSYENYVAAKQKIFDGKGAALINRDDRNFDTGARDTYDFSVTQNVERGVFVDNGILYDWMEGDERAVFNLRSLENLKGVHNYQNIAAAYMACALCGCDPADIYEALQSFPGLAHRQFKVRQIDSASYINDSKATNAAATAPALASYGNIFWIVGGVAKEGGLKGLEDYASDIRHAFVIGDEPDEFTNWLKKNDVAFTICGTMKKAVVSAHEQVQAANLDQATVMLSPASASFDHYKNFEERGDDFAKLVNGL